MRAIQTFKQHSQALLLSWKPRWEQSTFAALQWLLRLAPSERQRVFGLTILVGALCGLAAVAFHLTIRAAEGLLIDRALSASGSTWILWTLVLPTLGGIVGGALLYYVVPDARQWHSAGQGRLRRQGRPHALPRRAGQVRPRRHPDRQRRLARPRRRAVAPAPAPAFSEAQTTLTDQPAFRRPRPFVPEQPGAAEPELRYHTVTLGEDAPAVGQAVRALALPPGVLLVTIERERQMLAPQGATVLAAGDQITLFAPPQRLPAALEVLLGTSTRPVGSVHT